MPRSSLYWVSGGRCLIRLCATWMQLGQVAASVMLLGPQRLLAESELYALGQQVADAAGRASKSAGSPSPA
ncbi:hypothetical protein FAGKG844_650004 [Frankia sp. AgKG'84/4]